MENPLIVVSGLPRSGTSLMMQLLAAGGIPPFTDAQRQADEHNPRGYYEWEAIKQIGKDHRILEPAIGSGKAIKVISALLPKLPKANRYNVIYLERDIGEIVRSQNKMIAARGEELDEEGHELTADRLRKHDTATQQWMAASRHVEFLRVGHRNLLRNPGREVSRIVKFVGEDLLPTRTEMAGVVEPSLYRNRAIPKWRSVLGL